MNKNPSNKKQPSSGKCSFTHGGVPFSQKDSYISDEAESKRGIITLKYPIDHDIVNNWDDTEKICHHTFFNSLHIEPDDHPVPLTDAQMNCDTNSRMMAHVMFESFQVSAMFVAFDATLGLFGAGRTTGVVLDSGYSIKQSVPISDGFSAPYSILCVDLAGRDLIDYLMKLQIKSGYEFTTTAEGEILCGVKEKLCNIAEVSIEEMQNGAKGRSVGMKRRSSFWTFRSYQLGTSVSGSLRLSPSRRSLAWRRTASTRRATTRS